MESAGENRRPTVAGKPHCTRSMSPRRGSVHQIRPPRPRWLRDPAAAGSTRPKPSTTVASTRGAAAASSSSTLTAVASSSTATAATASTDDDGLLNPSRHGFPARWHRRRQRGSARLANLHVAAGGGACPDQESSPLSETLRRYFSCRINSILGHPVFAVPHLNLQPLLRRHRFRTNRSSEPAINVIY